MGLQDGIMLVTELCDGDLFSALAEQECDHLDGDFCWYRRSALNDVQYIGCTVCLMYIHHNPLYACVTWLHSPGSTW